MRGFRVLAALMVGLMLSACGTVSREAFTAQDIGAAAPQGLSDVRFSAADPAAGLKFAQEVHDHTAGRKVNVLAISGGGSNGAYGAGILVGWTAAGNRPDFDIVTGVSTGALTAPFAYLGKDWDRRLTEAYTSDAADRILEKRGLDLFFNPSIFRNHALRDLVAKYVDPPLLYAIAVEHAKGRRLMIATTNLDTEETMIWDMGAIASRGDAAALQLFRDVLVASAAIPGVFPPILIEVEGGDRKLSEMHVDGSVTTPFFVAPETLLLSILPGRDQTGPGEVSVIVNGQIDGGFGFTKGDTLSILGRSWIAMSKAQLRTHLTANAAFTRRNGGVFRYSAIPDHAKGDFSGLDFASEGRRALFTLGYDLGKSGGAWAAPADPSAEVEGAAPSPSPAAAGH
ncbi:patatin family protein [Caulobacter vibrioides]|nr:patatin family protein [Caulobacter vibrioides]YP_002518369.1 patatin family phospholipase domain protein [Caulobacter vibrioides NA1000]ACL96461.1 patatin family phospholipase domain protein [Caulobacter vibrioides NA1000]ATC29733.1 patatin family protein [Caulobacter vibrioides]QXZ51253.1 patatin family protein [Caulobacter vibrioides]